MSVLMLVGLLAWNGLISWVNAWVCGKNWIESKAVGGWARVLVWCGAVQSAIGFSSIILMALLGVAHLFHVLPPKLEHAALSLWYLLIIVPALGTGFAILVESWRVALRDRSLLNLGTAGYNTVAMWHNAAGAWDGIGRAFADVASVIPSGDEDDAEAGLLLLAFAMVVTALAAGIFLTAALIRHYAGTVPLPTARFRARTA
jgi:hypothetical protein